MKIFVINDYITVKLEDDFTNIYVNGELFIQSKYLLLNIPAIQVKKFDKVESIDVAADVLAWTDAEQAGIGYTIEPESEFWGHCSNLQVWYEHGYDTRLLHSSLAFPLLKKLEEVGDPLARKIFQEEILSRFESGYPTVIAYLVETKLLRYLNREQVKYIIEYHLPRILTSSLTYDDKHDVFFDLVKIAIKRGLLEETFPNFVQSTSKFFFISRVGTFSGLIHRLYASHKQLMIAHSFLIENEFLTLLKLSEKEEYYIFPVYHKLLELATITGLLDKYFLVFLDPINFEYHFFFRRLMDAIKRTETFHNYFETIENKFLALIGGIKESSRRFDYYSTIFKAIVGTGLELKHFVILLKTIEKSLVGKKQYLAFHDLVMAVNYYDFIEEFLPVLLKYISKFPIYYHAKSFSTLLTIIHKNSTIETRFLIFLEEIDEMTLIFKYRTFTHILKVAKKSDLVKKHLDVLLGIFPSLPDISNLEEQNQVNAYSKLIEMVDGTDLENESEFIEWKDRNLDFDNEVS